VRKTSSFSSILSLLQQLRMDRTQRFYSFPSLLVTIQVLPVVERLCWKFKVLSEVRI